MVATIAYVIAALAFGALIGWFATRHAPTAPVVLPDPVVLSAYAEKRAALQREAPNAEKMSVADAAAALRSLSKQ